MSVLRALVSLLEAQAGETVIPKHTNREGWKHSHLTQPFPGSWPGRACVLTALLQRASEADGQKVHLNLLMVLLCRWSELENKLCTLVGAEETGTFQEHPMLALLPTKGSSKTTSLGEACSVLLAASFSTGRCYVEPTYKDPKKQSV